MPQLHKITEPSVSPAPGRAARRWSWRQGGVVLGLTPLVLLIVCWQLFGSEQAFTFPPPSTWWDATKVMNEAGELGPALRQTMTTFVIGV